MRIIKQLLLGAVGLFVLVFLFSLLLPSQVRISRAVLIKQPEDTIAARLQNIRDWSNWNALLQLDAGAEFKYDGDSMVSWTSQQKKDSTLNRILLHPMKDTVIPFVMNLFGQKELQCGFSLSKFEGVGGKATQLEWWILEKTGWTPWEKFYGIFADRLKGPVIEKSLDQFRARLEQP